MKALLFLLLMSFAVQAQAAPFEKASSSFEAWLVSLFLAALFYSAARYRWWLAIVMLPVSIIYFNKILGVWDNQAIIDAKGYLFVINLSVAGSLLIIASVIGAWFNIKALQREKELGEDDDI